MQIGPFVIAMLNDHRVLVICIGGWQQQVPKLQLYAENYATFQAC